MGNGLSVINRHEESKIRKAYFRLAQKYHPDKNPEGRVGVRFPENFIFFPTDSFKNAYINKYYCQRFYQKGAVFIVEVAIIVIVNTSSGLVTETHKFACIQDMFEKVNKAYEFLCTKSARIVDGPDPENIILILKAQSILFNRHKQGASAKSRDIPKTHKHTVFYSCKPFL